jgi:integrase
MIYSPDRIDNANVLDRLKWAVPYYERGFNRLTTPMAKIRRVPLSARVVAAIKRLYAQARDLPRADGYRPERHYMRGPGPRARARGNRTEIGSKPELPTQ